MVTRAILALTVVSLVAGSVQAVPTADLYRLNGQFSGNGGEFRVAPNQDLIDITAETVAYSSFSLVNTGSVFIAAAYDAQVSSQAMGGDALDPFTAYLYTEFRNGTLADYDYTIGSPRVASAGALQEVIWYLEDEIAKTWTDGDDSLQDRFYTAARNSGWTDTRSVRVLNLYTMGHVGDPFHLVDSQLCTIKPVPAPDAIFICSLGTVLVGYLRGRRAL
jgi:hypothetical protein